LRPQVCPILILYSSRTFTCESPASYSENNLFYFNKPGLLSKYAQDVSQGSPLEPAVYETLHTSTYKRFHIHLIEIKSCASKNPPCVHYKQYVKFRPATKMGVQRWRKQFTYCHGLDTSDPAINLVKEGKEMKPSRTEGSWTKELATYHPTQDSPY
jgi:hypothetical protein